MIEPSTNPTPPPKKDEAKAIRFSLKPEDWEKVQYRLDYIEESIRDIRTIWGNSYIISSSDWRSEPATDKQKATLRQYKAAFTDSITKGEASDLIKTIFEKKP